MKVCYNNAFRFLHNLPLHCSARGMFVSNNILTFDELLRKNQYRVMNTIENSGNLLVKNVSTIRHRNSKLWNFWRASLYIQ